MGHFGWPLVSQKLALLAPHSGEMRLDLWARVFLWGEGIHIFLSVWGQLLRAPGTPETQSPGRPAKLLPGAPAASQVFS